MLTRHRIALILGLIGLLTSCAPLLPPAPVEKRPPADFPDASYLRAAERGERVFRVAPERSLATIYTYRGGSLARLGHDHVIASHDLNGYALLAADNAQADLYVQLELLTVDEAALRAQAGFDTQPSENDIAGTRRNLFEKVLEAPRYAYARIHVDSVETNGNGKLLTVTLELHGVTQALRVPVEIQQTDNELSVSGNFSINQTDFGITPYSVLGGALQVRDRVELRFQIRATRL